MLTSYAWGQYMAMLKERKKIMEDRLLSGKESPEERQGYIVALREVRGVLERLYANGGIMLDDQLETKHQ